MALPLLSLPTEVVLMVLKNLVPGPLPIGTSSLQLNPDFRQRCKALQNLALASRPLHTLSQPLLYHTIALSRPMQIITLLRTLLETPGHAASVRNIACLVELRKEAPSHVIDTYCVPEWNQHIVPLISAALSDENRQFLGHAGLSTDRIDEDVVTEEEGEIFHNIDLERPLEFLEQIFAFLLCLLYRLEDILIQQPGDRFHPLYGMCTAVPPLFTLEDAFELGVENEDPVGVGNPFCALQSVRIQEDPDRESRDRRYNYQMGVDPVMLPSYELTNVDHVELLGDNGVWLRNFARQGTDLSAETTLASQAILRFRKLKDLRLYESRTCPRMLGHMLSEAKNLETLHFTYGYLHLNEHPWDMRYDNNNYDIEEMTLSEALSKVSETLNELRLELATSSHEEFREIRPLFPPIDCLHQFLHLTSLSINLRFLEKPPMPLDYDDPKCLSSISLPDTLEKLELVEFWHDLELVNFKKHPNWEKKCIIWTQNVLFKILTKIANARNSKPTRGSEFPKLIELTLKATRPLHEHKPDVVASELRYSREPLREPFDEGSAYYDSNMADTSDFYRLPAVNEAIVEFLWSKESLTNVQLYRHPGDLGHSIFSSEDEDGPPLILLKTRYGIPIFTTIFKEFGVDFHLVWQDWSEDELALKLGRYRYSSCYGVAFPFKVHMDQQYNMVRRSRSLERQGTLIDFVKRRQPDHKAVKNMMPP
ncbi:hypothetical protein F5Y18DRAFT_424474 [Xylariaceae sp. FL1019]|nr:hypothetical protein F5Y18DRAFT_424474 [Xylariaceae sp. FL1019]